MWLAWYASWMVAAAWSARAKTRMKTDRGGFHRYATGVGAVLLFLPHRLALSPADGEAFSLFFGRLWQASSAVGWVLSFLALAGFSFCWWARWHLGKLWSGFVTVKQDHRIVDTGPYGVVRHPIYSGAIFAALATALLRGTPAAIIGALLIAVGFSMTARVEEGFLRAQLGDDAYEGYSRRVGMVIPRLG